MHQKFFEVSLTSILPSGKGIIGKYALSHFDSNLGPMIDCHDPGRTASREPNIHNGSFNNAEQVFSYVSIYSTV